MMYQTLPDVKTIAIFRALQLGDLLCSVPAIRAIRHAYPDAVITLIGLPWQQGFVKRFSRYLDGFIEFPGWPGLPERQFDVGEVMQFLRRVQEMKFDLVVQMQGNGYIVNPMCVLFGAANVAGLCRAEEFCPDEKLFPVLDGREHEVKRFLRIAEVLGASSLSPTLEFPLLPGEEQEARRMMTELSLRPGKYVCIHPGARDPNRRWEPLSFARVGNALASRGHKVLLTGSKEEGQILNEVSRLMTADSIDLVSGFGQVGIGELAYLIRESAGLVSNDTGVSHIACALRVRSVIIFSAYSDPARWAPLDGHLHRCIRHEEAKNVMYVVNTVLRHIPMPEVDKTETVR
jgi:ADP-heptose:LPS heptosyltransferase